MAEVDQRGQRRLRFGVPRAKELVEFARRNGYRLDELVQIIEDVG